MITFILSIRIVKAFEFHSRVNIPISDVFFPRKKVKSALSPLQGQAAQDILQLLLRSEVVPRSHCIRLFQATAFQESSLLHFLRSNCNNFQSKTKVKVNETFFFSENLLHQKTPTRVKKITSRQKDHKTIERRLTGT